MNKSIYLGISMLEISIYFGMIMLSQCIKTMLNYIAWIQTALLFILKLKIFINILQMELKSLTHQITVKIVKDLLQEV